MVISILGLLAGLAVPAVKDLGKANARIGAVQQLMDAVGRARQLAMSQHTTVYMVFVPTNYFAQNNTPTLGMQGWKPQIIGYRGSAPLSTDLIGGSLPVAIDTFETLYPLHEAGKIKVLAMSGAQRAAFAKDVPTFRESGLDITASGWNAFFAPATMPPAKVEALAQAIHAVMQEPALQASFATTRMTPVVSTRAQTAAMLKAYRAQWLPVVQRSGFQP